MKRFLITLVGQGDTDLKLVHPAAEAWINKDVTQSGRELIPLKLFEGEQAAVPDRRMELGRTGSPENDRALACPGQSFDNSKDLIRYMRANSIVLTGVYAGMIY